VGNQAPLKEVERPLFRFVVLPIDEQLLARGSIVSPWDIAQPAIADIEALDNGEAKRPGTLDNATTHRAISRLARVRSRRMTGDSTVILGIEIPSSDPIFPRLTSVATNQLSETAFA
jgi:hypothetical protein